MLRPVLALLFLTLPLAAGAARAQMNSMMTPMPPANSVTYGGDLNMGQPPTQQQRYNQKLIALREKFVRTTRADGGQLSDEHKAALQKELDAINKQFGIKPAG